MYLTYKNVCIACLVKWIRPRIILEIGTYMGRTTRTLFLNSDDDTEIYTVDLPSDYILEADITDRQLAEQSMRLTKRCYLPTSPRIHQVLADSTKLDWKKMVGNQIDLIVIDGNHNMFHVSSDTRNAIEVVSDHGAIIWDDSSYRSYMWYKEDFRGHEAIRLVLSKSQLQYVYRMSGTDLTVYWPRLPEMIL